MVELLAGSKCSLLLLSYKCKEKKDLNGIPYVDMNYIRCISRTRSILVIVKLLKSMSLLERR